MRRLAAIAFVAAGVLALPSLAPQSLASAAFLSTTRLDTAGRRWWAEAVVSSHQQWETVFRIPGNAPKTAVFEWTTACGSDFSYAGGAAFQVTRSNGTIWSWSPEGYVENPSTAYEDATPAPVSVLLFPGDAIQAKTNATARIALAGTYSE